MHDQICLVGKHLYSLSLAGCLLAIIVLSQMNHFKVRAQRLLNDICISQTNQTETVKTAS